MKNFIAFEIDIPDEFIGKEDEFVKKILSITKIAQDKRVFYYPDGRTNGLLTHKSFPEIFTGEWEFV